MNHSEAVEQMAAERYLLDELTPNAREAFEEHLFDCPECALDLRTASAFVEEAKAQLPGIMAHSAPAVSFRKSGSKSSFWLSLFRPAFAAPVFAALLAIVVFQNAVTFPSLRQAANQPRLVPLTPLHPATRGGSHATLTADRSQGVALQVELPVEPGAVSYSFDLHDPQGKLVWATTISAPTQESIDGEPLSILIPGGMLQNGTYSLAVTGIGPHGERTPVEQYIFDIVLAS